jgi:hypothetical protein
VEKAVYWGMSTFFWAVVCLGELPAGAILAATAAGTTGIPLFEPGKEYHIVTDNPAIGTQSFNLYVPRDYTNDRDWPVIFHYTGRGEKYNPSICRGARSATCDRGAIAVGMGYLEPGKTKFAATEITNYTGRELRSISEATRLISKHLRIDDDRLFISGTSAFRDLPIFFGSSLPGANHGANHKWAVKGATIYEARGAIVTFQVYTGEWLVCSPLLRDWVRAYVLGDQADSASEKRAQWQQLTRKMPHEIDSTQIVKAQIAKQLDKQPDQLTRADLLGTTELSLMGQYVSDVSYLAQLTNLQALDISFTYVDTVEPLLHCRSLRKLDISDTDIKDIGPLGKLPQLATLSMWNLWLDREHIDHLKEDLPDLEIIDYQWDLYEKDTIGRILPKLRVKLNQTNHWTRIARCLLTNGEAISYK